MKHYLLQAWAGFAIACLAVTGCFAQDHEAGDQPVARPNIVWLMSEDSSIHNMRLYTESGAEMPNIEALAEHGLVFDHAFSNAPVCSVARTTLITGCYAPRIGTQYHRKAEPVPMPDGLAMFPAYLREAGYYTANNSKTDFNAKPGERAPWDRSNGKATWRDREPGQPFFFVRTLPTTHESRLHFQNTDEPTDAGPENMVVAPIFPDTPLFRYTYARLHDQHAQIDRQFGQIIDELKADGLMDDTFIFYFADHGGVLPGSKAHIYERGLHVPLIVYVPKNFAHLLDEPLQEHGKRVEGFVEFVDFGPTVLNLAGVEAPKGIDGEAFLGKGVTLEELNQRDEAFGYADRFDEKYDMVRSLRIGKYKYIRSYQPFNVDSLYSQYRYRQLAYQQWRQMYQAGELNEVQAAFFEPRPAEMLFDIEADPYETQNLANDPAHKEELLQSRAALSKRVRSLPDLSFIPEPVMLREAMVIAKPAAFGQLYKQQINRLADIADLQLLDYADAEQPLIEALGSRQDSELYWALITATTFGKEAKALTPAVQEITRTTEDPLVLARAAEFFAINGDKAQAAILLTQALNRSRTDIETLLILNSVTLMHDTVDGLEIEVTVQPEHLKNGWVKDRMNYLDQK